MFFFPGHSPSLNELIEVVNDVNWYQLGLKLQLRSGKLHEIESDYCTRGEARIMAKMLDTWLKQNPDACWDDLMKALVEMGENRAARDIAIRYSRRPFPTGM